MQRPTRPVGGSQSHPWSALPAISSPPHACYGSCMPTAWDSKNKFCQIWPSNDAVSALDDFAASTFMTHVDSSLLSAQMDSGQQHADTRLTQANGIGNDRGLQLSEAERPRSGREREA